MSNPAGGAAKKQLGVDNAYATNFNAQGGQAFNDVMPFLTGEVNNPQGFGDSTVSKMKTEGGQIASAGAGQATEAAQLLGSRTGNTAAAPGIIDASSRNAMKQESNDALGIDIANSQAKLGQQQAGASGLTNIYGGASGDALKALGLSDESIAQMNNAYANSFTGKFATGYGAGLAKNLTSPPVPAGNG